MLTYALNFAACYTQLFQASYEYSYSSLILYMIWAYIFKNQFMVIICKLFSGCAPGEYIGNQNCWGLAMGACTVPQCW